MKKNLDPVGYPNTSNSGIHDAQAFSIGESLVVHRPAHYPDARTVVAACGAYGYTAETDTREAVWRDSRPSCIHCTSL